MNSNSISARCRDLAERSDKETAEMLEEAADAIEALEESYVALLDLFKNKEKPNDAK